MTRTHLIGIIVVLLITNIATLLMLERGDMGLWVHREEEWEISSSDDSVARIDGEEISYEDWMSALHESYGEKTLKYLIDRHVVSKLAEERDIEISEKVIERDLAYLTSMQGPLTEDELEKEKEKWRDEIIYRYQLEFLLTEGVSIPENEIGKYYHNYKNQYNFRPAMQLSHIVVPDMETAQKVYEELGQGANFELLAKEYSVDEETKDNGGYLGFINTNSQFFPRGYLEVAKQLEEHSYSEPFTVDQGVAIIFLHQALPGIEFSFEEIKPYIKNELALHRENIALEATSLWQEVDIDWIYAN